MFVSQKNKTIVDKINELKKRAYLTLIQQQTAKWLVASVIKQM